jgi:CubicO group peptidase (beta-lactamase class C family)
VASIILGFVIEAVSGLSYEQYVYQEIIEPLGLTNTSISEAPDLDSWGFIPVGETWWGSSLGYSDMYVDND